MTVKCGTAIVYTDGKQLNESFTVLRKATMENSTV